MTLAILRGTVSPERVPGHIKTLGGGRFTVSSKSRFCAHIVYAAGATRKEGIEEWYESLPSRGDSDGGVSLSLYLSLSLSLSLARSLARSRSLSRALVKRALVERDVLDMSKGTSISAVFS